MLFLKFSQQTQNELALTHAHYCHTSKHTASMSDRITTAVILRMHRLPGRVHAHWLRKRRAAAARGRDGRGDAGGWGAVVGVRVGDVAGSDRLTVQGVALAGHLAKSTAHGGILRHARHRHAWWERRRGRGRSRAGRGGNMLTLTGGAGAIGVCVHGACARRVNDSASTRVDVR
jgi:hypothetical protein